MMLLVDCCLIVVVLAVPVTVAVIVATVAVDGVVNDFSLVLVDWCLIVIVVAVTITITVTVAVVDAVPIFIAITAGKRCIHLLGGLSSINPTHRRGTKGLMWGARGPFPPMEAMVVMAVVGSWSLGHVSTVGIVCIF